MCSRTHKNKRGATPETNDTSRNSRVLTRIVLGQCTSSNMIVGDFSHPTPFVYALPSKAKISPPQLTRTLLGPAPPWHVARTPHLRQQVAALIIGEVGHRLRPFKGFHDVGLGQCAHKGTSSSVISRWGFNSALPASFVGFEGSLSGEFSVIRSGGHSR